MSVMPTRGQSILVETAESLSKDSKYNKSNPGAELAGWIQTRVNIWEDVRNRGYQRLWGEYWRMWRGKWNEADKNRLSERSQLVAPALAQAIEQTVSEVEEAIFSKEDWFDVGQKQQLQDQVKSLLIRDQLLEDLDKVNAADQIMEAVLNGAIFGTMIAKLNVFVGNDQKPSRDPGTFELKTANKKRVFVTIESIRPDEFIPDPVGKTIQQMEGCAHRVQRTLHYVLEKIEQGIYRKDALASVFPTRRLKNSDVDQEDSQSVNTTYESSQVDLIEYHGKVPAKFLLELERADKESPLDKILAADLKDIEKANGNGPMIEAVVTIANSGVLLRAMANPYAMQDRAIVAAQFEKVPSRFWGRGVAEKGYNPQKALDCELRARMDALGYISAPMLGVDSGRIPRGFRLEVKPGKVWTTQGPPNEVLQPVRVGEYNTLTFQQTQEMERMVQMGTGAFDTATALKSQSQSGGASATGNSMLMGAFVKRSKRSIANISRNFVLPLLEKSLWRYMQFDPIRYEQDFDLVLKPTLGIVAREIEASQMTQMMGMMPTDFHQAQLVLAKGIVSNTSLTNKAEILKVIDGIINPSPEAQKQQQAQHQMQMQTAQATLEELQAKVKKINAEVEAISAKGQKLSHEAGLDEQRLSQDNERIQQQYHEQALFAQQNKIAEQRLGPEWLKAQAAMKSASRPVSSSK